MRPADEWLDAYGADHTQRSNRLLHWACVPLIVVAVVGLLWSLPVPGAFSRSSPALNWGTIFLMAAVVYYFIMSFNLALGLLPFVLCVVAVVAWLESFPAPLWLISSGLFLAAWLGQLIGHRLEGGRWAPLKDIQLLMIGPAWLLANVYRRLRIPY